jgi:antitoxin component YwqK of YwqJK toxin-antitoxin module
LYQCWYHNGQLREKNNYINGKKESLYKSWRYNGQLYEKYECISDEKKEL